MRKEIASDTQTRNPDILEQRLAMFRHGFLPIPCESKTGMDPGWSKVKIDEKYIRGLHKRRGGSKRIGTGIRLAGDIFVIDLDIKETEIINAVLDAIERAYPEFFAGALWRHSGAVSLALFGRVSKRSDGKILKGRKSRKFGRRQADGSFADKAQVEVWSGEAWDENYGARYFAAFGPHRVEGREYDWDGDKSPVNTPLASLPVFDGDQVGPLLDLVESVLAQFLEPYDDRRDLEGAKNEYILTPETEFRLADGGLTTVAALEAQLPPGVNSGVRGLMGFEDVRMSEGRDHCHAYVRDMPGDNFGRLAIRNFDLEIMYYFENEKPPEPVELDDETRATLKALRDSAEAAPGEAPETHGAPLTSIKRADDPKETYARATNWLVANMAWFTQAYNGRGGVVSIHPDGPFQSPVTLTAMRGLMTGYSYQSKGKKGGLKTHNPIDAWMLHPQRVVIDGLRMRPELPRPWFSEGDLTFLNRYFPPAHPTSGGHTLPFHAYLKRLVPEAAERAWVFNWLALKVQKPHWRMIALVMVAREMGSGRGLLVEAMQYVLGERFVISTTYAKLSGGAGSRFNVEMVDRLLVCVNEARDADDRKFSHKNAAREALKDFIEPNHRIPFRVEPKGIDAYFTLAAFSTWINSNNVDALPLGDGDRRAAVVRCGPKAGVAEREAFQAWMLNAENIGALYRELRAHKVERDKAVFDPYDAPLFRSRDLMIEAGKTAIDHAWEAAVEKIGSGAELYTQSQIVVLTRYFGKAHGPDFDEMVKKHNGVRGHRIGVKRPKEVNWKVRYGNADDNREPVYALSEAAADVWTHAEPDAIRTELDKAQKVVEAPMKAFNKLLQGVAAGSGKQ